MTTASAPPLRWWGWGARDVPVPRGLLHILREECGVSEAVVTPHVDRAAVRLPESQLQDRLRRRLAAVVGAPNVQRDDDSRLRHARGRSYTDLLALRSGRIDSAPDAVLRARPDDLQRVLRVCSEEACAVVPFGGGTSVVGGVSPLRGAQRAVISLVLHGDERVDVDERSLLATLPAWVNGPEAERALARRHLTLGHFPQSYEYATVGGFAATRSSGQVSAGYGRFDSMVRGVRCVAPSARIDVVAAPPDATGPSTLEMLLGSEGTCGVFTHVTARVRRRPRTRHYAGWSFPDVEAGCGALRSLVQSRALPDVARLSDAEETRVSFAGSESQATQLAIRYLRLRGHARPCLLIAGWEGDAVTVRARALHAARVLRRHGGVALGSAPGRAWLRARFDAPYLRDSLMDHAVLVETLETAATWSNLDRVRRAVIAAVRGSLRAQGRDPLIGCHVSHVYPEGASLYFTVLTAQDGEPREQWLRAKAAATDAVLGAGGALSHHHGVGADHAPWLARAHGDAAVSLLRAVRAELDPAGIMNPGKLLQ